MFFYVRINFNDNFTALFKSIGYEVLTLYSFFGHSHEIHHCVRNSNAPQHHIVSQREA